MEENTGDYFADSSLGLKGWPSANGCLLLYYVEKLRVLLMLWNYVWNISYIELRIWNQVSYDRRS